MEVQDVPVIVHVCVTVKSVIHFTSSTRGVNVKCKMPRPVYVFRGVKDNLKAFKWVLYQTNSVQGQA